MCADKPNHNVAYREFNKYYEPIVIPFDVEYVSLISNAIYAVEGLLDVGKARPGGFFSLMVPIFQCSLCLWILGVIHNQCTFCDNSHIIRDFVQRYNRYFEFQNNIQKNLILDSGIISPYVCK